MKVIRYKGVQVNKPDNISLKYIKKIVDTLGKDGCFSVDALVNFLSKHPPYNHHPADIYPTPKLKGF